jgi:jumonji domain-containing protein 7
MIRLVSCAAPRPALRLWSNNDYLREKIGDSNVTIDIDPTGHADSVYFNKFFVTPIEQQMKFNEFLDILENKVDSDAIHYCQHQNSSFTEEFEQLAEDIEIPSFITEAFNCPAELINLWCGSHQSITTLHNDYYENIYFVVRGSKQFTLYPPTDVYFLPQKAYRKAHWERFDSANPLHNDKEESRIGDYVLVEDEKADKVYWYNEKDEESEQLLRYANPLHVEVHAGEILYLPSLYYHRVEQSNDVPVIAVNAWFNMNYDIKYNYYKFAQLIAREKHKAAAAAADQL